MTMGIEHFRTLVTDKSGLEDRRVTVGDNNGKQTVEAPKDWWGRRVAWIKSKLFGELPTAQVVQANQGARGAFYNALVKSHGQEVADRALRKVYGYQAGEEVQFQHRATTLQASTVKRVLDSADKYRGEYQRATEKLAYEFVKTGNLFEAMQGVNVELRHPGITGVEPGLERKFYDLIRMHPDYTRKRFSVDEMIDIAAEAARQYIEDRKNNFDDRFPEMAELENGIAHDARSYFQDLRTSLQGTMDSLRQTAPEEAKWIDDALTAIESTATRLSETPFDRLQARQLSEELQAEVGRLYNLRLNTPSFMLRAEQAEKALDALSQAINAQFPNISDGDRQRLSDALAAHINDWIGSHYDDLVTDGDARSEFCLSLGDVVANNLPEGINEEDRNTVVSNFVQAFTQQLEPRFVEFDTAREKLRDTSIALERELQHQSSLLIAKGNSLRQYSERDPLSDKAVAFEEMVLAKATLLALQDIDSNLRQELDDLKGVNDDDLLLDGDTLEQRREKLENDLKTLAPLLINAEQRARSAEQRHEKASTERGATPVEERRAQVKNLWESQRIFLLRYLNHAEIPPENDAEDLLVQYRTEALETLPGWQKISRTIVASRDGVTNVYRSEITPHSQIGGAVGQPFPQEGQEGVDDLGSEESGDDLGQTRSYHPPNLQVSELIRVDSSDGKQTTNMARIIRHGVVDAWTIENPEERARVSKENAREVLTVGVQLDEDFRTKAVQRLRKPELDIDGNPKRNKIVHININLESTDPSARRAGRHEVEFTRHQFTAFESLSVNGQVELLVDTDVDLGEDDIDVPMQTEPGFNLNQNKGNVENDEIVENIDDLDDDIDIGKINFFDDDSGVDAPKQRRQDVGQSTERLQKPEDVDDPNQPLQKLEKVTFDLETITFAFGVNDRSRYRQYYDHNRDNLIKLYGDPKPLSAPGGIIGEVVTKLKDRANTRGTDPEEVKEINELVGMIQREVDTARTLFENGSYIRTGNDPYKMIRTVMRIVNLGAEALEFLEDDTTMLSLSEGCRENLDGGSVADAEHKTQVISEDLGGRVRAGEGLDPQNRLIYQNVLTGSGQTEMSQMYSGQHGGRHYNDLRYRIGDQLVIERLTGKTQPDPVIEALDENLDGGNLFIDDNRNIEERNDNRRVSRSDDD